MEFVSLKYRLEVARGTRDAGVKRKIKVEIGVLMSFPIGRDKIRHAHTWPKDLEEYSSYHCKS